jgi:hypothetical protein
VTQIALWRYHDRLRYGTIAERLNADLTKYSAADPAGKNPRPRRLGQNLGL